MYCRHCGEEIIDGSAFCPKCGGAQGEDPSREPEVEAPGETKTIPPTQDEAPEHEPVVTTEPEPEPVTGGPPAEIEGQVQVTPGSEKAGRNTMRMVAAVLVVVVLVVASLGWYFLVYNKDSDGDGHVDRLDAFPNRASEWSDADDDGFGDNEDVFPDDGSEWLDTDEDGVGDNTDPFPSNADEWADTDEDGVGDNQDEFPSDPTEWVDTDGDEVGDNADAFPNDPEEWADTDEDGRGDNSDAFPNDANEWADNDGDGTGDNADPDDDDDGVLDTDDLYPQQNAVIVLTVDEFTLKDPIDYDSFGQIWIEIKCHGQETVYLPEPGHYQECEINVPWDISETFEFDVPDDEAEWSISMTAMDQDDFFDDYVDISPASTKVLYITYNIQTETIEGDVDTGSADGSGDGSGDTDDDDGLIKFALSLKLI